MKKTTKVKKKSKSEVKSDYTVFFKVFGKSYEGKGQTLKEAIESLNFKGKIGGVSIFTVSHGDNKKERVMNTVIASRLFSSSRIMREIAIKNMLTLFDNL